MTEIPEGAIKVFISTNAKLSVLITSQYVEGAPSYPDEVKEIKTYTLPQHVKLTKSQRTLKSTGKANGFIQAVILHEDSSQETVPDAQEFLVGYVMPEDIVEQKLGGWIKVKAITLTNRPSTEEMELIHTIKNNFRQVMDDIMEQLAQIPTPPGFTLTT